jgi:FkbM family methyltransferase
MNMRLVKRTMAEWMGIGAKFRGNLCFAQDGEDLILDRLLQGQQDGFFVDVGAHHPVRFSNTYLFYKRGWRGINIDAEPGSMKSFNRHRSRDINVECGVAAQSGQLIYYRFNEPALNTFEPVEAERKNRPPYLLVEKVLVPVRPLGDLLSECLPPGQLIDFLTVDVEGKDLEVLESNDWDRFRPRFVLAETLRMELEDVAKCPTARLMARHGYRPIAKAYNTTFFSSGSST